MCYRHDQFSQVARVAARKDFRLNHQREIRTQQPERISRPTYITPPFNFKVVAKLSKISKGMRLKSDANIVNILHTRGIQRHDSHGGIIIQWWYAISINIAEAIALH